MQKNRGHIAMLVSFWVLLVSGHAQVIEETSLAYSPKINSLNDLLAEYDRESLALLPILVPSHEVQKFDGGRLIVEFDGKDLPLEFVKQLSICGVEQSGVMTYPVVVRLHPKTHDYEITANDGSLLFSIKRAAGYDPYWYVRERFPELAVTDATEFEAQHAIHDPTRIVGCYTLVTPDGARALDEIEEAAQEAALRDATGQREVMRMAAFSGGDSDTLRFSEIQYGVPGSSDIQVTIGYPSDLRGVALDIVGCTNLTDWIWSRMFSTNAAFDADSFTFAFTPEDPVRFLTCFRPGIDSDGDGVSDGDERFMSATRSDPNNPDDPPNVKGTISYSSYSGGQTGLICVVAVTNAASWGTNISACITTTGTYQIIRIPPGDYWIKAWRDSDGDGSVGMYEATGLWSSVAISISNQWTGINITLDDPDIDGDSMGDWWERIYWPSIITENDTGDPDGDKLNNLYEYYAGTDPTAGFEDSDGDGMSDDWEKWHGLDRYNAGDATDDPDGDGFTNLSEFQANPTTDPWDADSHPTYFEDVTASVFPAGVNLTGSQSVAWGDFDNDGDPDLYLSSGVWRNNNGLFTNISSTSFGVGLWLDANNDGFLDIFTWMSGGSATNWGLYTNKLNFGVTGFAKDLEFPSPTTDPSNPGYRSRGACPVDFNVDGYIDLYIGGYESLDGLYVIYRDTMIRNRQGMSPFWNSGTRWLSVFEQSPHGSMSIETYQFATTAGGGGPTTRSRGITACDYDEDGDADIHVANYRTEHNVLWRRAAGEQHFDVGGLLGIAGHGFSIGTVWGDIDNDGYFDLFTANLLHTNSIYDASQFYRNLGPNEDYRFTNMTGVVGLPWQEAYACPVFADFDRDGAVDIYVTVAPGYSGQSKLFRNEGAWHFTDITLESGLSTATNQGTYQNAWADYDGDGDLDLFTGGKLYRNRISAGHWIKLKLFGDGLIVNRAAIGTTVKIELGDRILTRQVEGAVGEGNQNDFTLHFGLGTNGGPVNVIIRWPGQSEVVVSNLAINQSHQLVYTRSNNNNFTNAVALPGLAGRLTARNGDATLDVGEPEHGSGASVANRSLWWSFSPPENGTLTIVGKHSMQSELILALYSGTNLAQLVPVKKADDGGLYEIAVTQGVPCRVAVADSATNLNDTIALEWKFCGGHIWAVLDKRDSDSDSTPMRSWMRAPEDVTNGMPLLVQRSDIPNSSNRADLVLWKTASSRIQGQLFVVGDGLRTNVYAELQDMGTWVPAATGRLHLIDYVYEEDGLGIGIVLLSPNAEASDFAVLEIGFVDYTDNLGPGWVALGSTIFTNGQATGLFRPFKCILNPQSGANRLIWKGSPNTNSASTVLVQDLNSGGDAIVSQFAITSTNAISELVDCRLFTNNTLMLLWKPTTALTNAVILEKYSWAGNLLGGWTVLAGTNYSDAEMTPVCLIPPQGSEPSKLLWAYSMADDHRHAAVHHLDANFAVTAMFNYFNFGLDSGALYPIDYLYTGIANAFRILWKFDPNNQ